jgi:hypothetical protein
MDKFSPRKSLLEKEPMAQKMGPKVVPEWTSFPQRKVSLKKNQWIIMNLCRLVIVTFSQQRKGLIVSFPISYMVSFGF